MIQRIVLQDLQALSHPMHPWLQRRPSDPMHQSHRADLTDPWDLTHPWLQMLL